MSECFEEAWEAVVKRLRESEPVACRVVTVLPNESWKVEPTAYGELQFGLDEERP